MARANPLLGAVGAGAVRPELDLMAEHKALMERFAAAAMAAQTAAAASAASSAKETTSPTPPPPPPPQPTKVETTSSPPASPKTAGSGTPEPPQNAPMDLSNKKSDEESEISENEEMETTQKNLNLLKKKIRSDLNRNLVHQSIASSEEDDDEELDVGENLSR